MAHNENLNRGLFYGVCAFFLWGLAPIYFKAVGHVAPLEVLAHRVIWSVVILSLVLSWRKQWQVLKAFTRKQILPYFASSVFITSNWFIFIWAVGENRVLETSLGYFINPLFSILLAFVILGERLNKLQSLAVGLATLGVLNQIWTVGHLPWIALALATSFSVYGLLRKAKPIDPVIGLFVETILLLPIALIYCFWLESQSQLAFGNKSLNTDLLLILAGFMTSVPLLFFAAGTQRLRLSTMGIIQYLTPSMTFLMAVYLYQEPFNRQQLISFLLIWLGLIVFTLDGLKRRERER